MSKTRTHITTKYTPLQVHQLRQRRIHTKSHYKMTCVCCKKAINRGDDITQIRGTRGSLRTRGGGSASDSYTPSRNNWVHLTCKPAYCYRHGCPPVMLVSGHTWYSYDIGCRQQAAAMDPDWGENWWDIPEPQWVLKSARIRVGISKFQMKFRELKRKQRFRSVVKMAIQDAKRFHGSESLLGWQIDLLSSLLSNN